MAYGRGRGSTGNGSVKQGTGKPAGSKSYSGKGTEKNSRGTMPGVAGRPVTGKDAVVAGERGITEKIEPTYAPQVSTLDTNHNIGCGYGAVSGKGKREP